MAKVSKIIFVLLFFSILSIAQNNDIRFENLTVEDGLSNNFIRSIAQDSAGFMWFATEDGLNKYDGYTFTVYRHDPEDPTSLSENKVEMLQVDKKGILWVGTDGGGLNAFNPSTEKFTRYNPDPDNPIGISKELIYDLYLDKRGSIWFSPNDKGLYRYNPETDIFTNYTHKPGDPNTISTNSLLMIGETVEKGRQIIWAGAWGNGLNKFEVENKKWKHYWHNPHSQNSLTDNYIGTLYADKYGSLWMGTSRLGLDKLDTYTDNFTNYRNDPDNPKSISSNIVGNVCEKDGSLWITTMNGLNRLNIKNEEFTSWFHNPSDPATISQNSSWAIYESKGGLLWIGGWSGLDFIDFEQKPFVIYQQQPGNNNSLSDKFVSSILATRQDDGNILWAGTKDGGLNKIDRRTGQVTHYRHDSSDPNSLSDNFIFSITESFYKGKKVLWLGTLDGLNRFDPQTEKFTRYYHNPEDTTSLSENIIHKVYTGRDGSIWIGTRNQGLCRFDPIKKEFQRFHHRAGETWVIHEDSSGFLWHGSALYGLIKLNPLTKKVTFYRHNPQDPKSINSNTIRSMHESVFKGNNVLWIGTNAGINCFEYNTEQFHRYTRKDGLPSDEINGILEDKKGNLWLSTGYGLSKFDPVSGTTRNYDKDDDLPGNQFLRGSYFQGENGEMFFGSTNGMTAFFPEQIYDNPHIPKIVLTNFQIFNKSVPVKNNSLPRSDDYFLPRHISALNQIELSYDQNVFSFEFAALDYRKPQKNQYAYLMEGVDPEWVYTDASRRFATYTNLDPGEYTFHVKGSINDGFWNEEGTSIKVIILPPWWETQLAYIFYFVFFISSIVITWRLQLRRIHLKQQMQMKNFEAEKLRDVDGMKSRFFANISHEFRTPLTLIKGPVKQMLDGKFAGNTKDQYKMIIRNSDRLLRLINQILDLSKLESGGMKLQVAETNISDYLKGLVLSFASLAERKRINLKFDSKNIRGFVDRDKLEKITSNLLSNAFKFTPEGGEITVAIEIPNVQSQMPNQYPIPNSKFQISISNTGPGIQPDHLDKIFDRFYQANSPYQSDSEGTGIGLALTKELVEVCHGEISLSSIPSKKTTFTITLPIARESFKEDEIIEEVETTGRRPETEQSEDFISENSASGLPSPVSDIRSAVSGLRSPLLLIVEDNPDVTSYIRSFMDHKYRFMTAENGKEGLKKTIEEYPDLIISDVMMPEMDGFELCKKIKTDERISHIPVILLTAKADLDSKIDGLEFGADDYVTKPFEAKELQIRTRNLIGQRRKLREKFSQLNYLNPEDIAVTSADEKLLQRLLDVFENHIEEADFTTKDFAREVGMSRMNLNRKLQALANQSTNEFLMTMRLRRAAFLLKKNAGTVSEIAYKVGFSNTSYFARLFRKKYGISPGRFIKQNK